MAKPFLIHIFGSEYSIDQCGDTMTIGELIDLLSEYDADLPVYTCDHSGYGGSCFYGTVTEGKLEQYE